MGVPARSKTGDDPVARMASVGLQRGTGVVDHEEEHTIENQEQSDKEEDTDIRNAVKTKEINSTLDNEELTSSTNNLRLCHTDGDNGTTMLSF